MTHSVFLSENRHSPYEDAPDYQEEAMWLSRHSQRVCFGISAKKTGEKGRCCWYTYFKQSVPMGRHSCDKPVSLLCHPIGTTVPSH